MIGLGACAPKNEYVAPPPARVTVAHPTKKDVVDYVDFTGLTDGHKVVEVRARVKGFLKEILYKPGTLVEEGTPLFQIDATEYLADQKAAAADVKSTEADLTSARAAVTRAKAALELAETTVRKLESAYEARAVSEIQVLEARATRDVDVAKVKEAEAQVEVAVARVGVAKAKLERATLNVDFCAVKAPLKGYVAMWEVEVGTLVGATDATLLTTIVNDERIFAYFDVPERWLLEARDARNKSGAADRAEVVTVKLGLVHEEGFPHVGVGDYAEPTVDVESGTLRVRAVFENKDRTIPPGGFVRIRLPIAERKGAILIPERALGNDQTGSFLLVVNADDKVERREVKLGRRHGDHLVALDGVKESDRIIVSGLQRARPGATVKATMEAKK